MWHWAHFTVHRLIYLCLSVYFVCFCFILHIVVVVLWAQWHGPRPPGIPVREWYGRWNSRESRTPKIPAGNSREFLKFWWELREIYIFCLFSIFIVDCDILLFNLTHWIMCTTHDRLTAFWAKPWMVSLTQLFVFIEFWYTFKYWYRKITEQRHNFANSDRYTNEDAEIMI